MRRPPESTSSAARLLASATGPRPPRRALSAGAAAGLIGGLAFTWAMQTQGLRAAAGLAGLPSTGTGVALEILAAILIGAGYGAIFRYQPFAYAATIRSGVLYGLLWWLAGPLTPAPT